MNVLLSFNQSVSPYNSKEIIFLCFFFFSLNSYTTQPDRTKSLTTAYVSCSTVEGRVKVLLSLSLVKSVTFLF